MAVLRSSAGASHQRVAPVGTTVPLNRVGGREWDEGIRSRVCRSLVVPAVLSLIWLTAPPATANLAPNVPDSPSPTSGSHAPVTLSVRHTDPDGHSGRVFFSIYDVSGAYLFSGVGNNDSYAAAVVSPTTPPVSVLELTSGLVTVMTALASVPLLLGIPFISIIYRMRLTPFHLHLVDIRPL